MIIKIGKFFFRYRNTLFPIVFALLFFGGTWPVFKNEHVKTGEIIIGIMVALSGQVIRALTIGLAYIKRGGKKKQVYAEKLVHEGIFAHSRNPLYLGNILILTGVGIAANSLPFVMFGIPFFIFAYWTIICAEESYLEKKFGQEFKDYCSRVNRFIPSASGLGSTIKSMEFNWKRLIIKEYSTPFAWVTGITLLIMKEKYLDWGYEGIKYTLWPVTVFLLTVTFAFFTAWYLKKRKILRVE